MDYLVLNSKLLVRLSLDCVFSLFLRANSDRVVDARNEDLAIPDLAGLCGLNDGLHGGIDRRIANHNLKF